MPQLLGFRPSARLQRPANDVIGFSDCTCGRKSSCLVRNGRGNAVHKTPMGRARRTWQWRYQLSGSISLNRSVKATSSQRRGDLGGTAM